MKSSPICDARLPDGSRVNVIAPPLAIDGAALTIRKFKKDKLKLDQLVRFGAITPEGAECSRSSAASAATSLISGGTGSGKTTLLNCLTDYVDHDERVITCEDAAELQLQQPHVVRLETRPPNLEGEGEITMRDLVKNCLRMRPERIIVGEVRGPEAFDLLQAMNTGHDGSMGTHPRQQPARSLEPPGIDDRHGRLRAAVEDDPRNDRRFDRRHRPGCPPARRFAPHHPHTEVIGMEGDVIITQDICPLRDLRARTPTAGCLADTLDRHRPAAFLGAGALLRRGAPSRRRARGDGTGRLAAERLLCSALTSR